jgi:hypothetical protein
MKQLSNYKEKGSFTFKKGNDLKVQSNKVPEKKGIFCIYTIKNLIEELVYIGYSGTPGKKQRLKGRINNKQEKIKREKYFNNELEDGKIDEIKVCWYVTPENDSPRTIKTNLLKRYYTEKKCLPAWNKTF